MRIGQAPEALSDIHQAAEAIGAAFWPVNLRIHDNPELGFHEFIAHEALTAFMESQPGWTVQRSVYGMETAWIALFDSGVPGATVSFNAEYGTPSTLTGEAELTMFRRRRFAWHRSRMRAQLDCDILRRGGCGGRAANGRKEAAWQNRIVRNAGRRGYVQDLQNPVAPSSWHDY